jgi:hypothetical protein
VTAIIDGFRDVLTWEFIWKCLVIMLICGGTAIVIMALGTWGFPNDDSK